MSEGITDIPNTLWPRLAEFFFNHFAVGGFFIHAIDTDFQTAQRLLEGFLEGTTDRHHFTYRFHLGGEVAISLREFLKRETRYLGNDIINRWLKRSRCRTAGNFIAQFVQRVTHRQLGGHLSDGETGGFRGQCRRTRYSRIHFNHDHATVFWIDCELHIRAAGVDSNFTQYRQGGVTHDLILFIRQGLCGRHGNRIARVHAHRVEVFDRTNDDAVIVFIAHHFHLKLFPAE